MFGGARWVGVMLVGLASMACSKSNAVDQSQTNVESQLGDQCTSDADCGVSAVCALGLCRVGCTNDAECPQGAICVGEAPPFGCTLPDEGQCSQATDCGALTCGIDNRCRVECAEDADCPRNEHACLAGACVSRNEDGAAETWFACEHHDYFCTWGVDSTPEPLTNSEGRDSQGEGHVMWLCNVIGPGWVLVDDCNDMAFWGDGFTPWCMAQADGPGPDLPTVTSCPTEVECGGRQHGDRWCEGDELWVCYKDMLGQPELAGQDMAAFATCPGRCDEVASNPSELFDADACEYLPPFE